MTQLKPAAASVEGVPGTGLDRSAAPPARLRAAAAAAAAAEADAEAEAEADAEAEAEAEAAAEADAEAEATAASGRTSVPTGVTLPSALNPQFSRLSAASTSVSAGQCSSVTISVTPLRRASPM